jgi:hypothetical protein
MVKAMVVRLRLRSGGRVSRKQGKNRHVALAFASLLWPGVLTAYVLGFWRLADDLGVAGGFGIHTGLFSHWQSWLALAIGLHVAAIILNRYGHRGEMRIPESWFAWIDNFGRRA